MFGNIGGNKYNHNYRRKQFKCQNKTININGMKLRKKNLKYSHSSMTNNVSVILTNCRRNTRCARTGMPLGEWLGVSCIVLCVGCRMSSVEQRQQWRELAPLACLRVRESKHRSSNNAKICSEWCSQSISLVNNDVQDPKYHRNFIVLSVAIALRTKTKDFRSNTYLTILNGTLVCSGTAVGKHCIRQYCAA